MSKISKFIGIIILASVWQTLTCSECPTYCVTCTQDSVDSGRPCTSCVPGKYSGRWLDLSNYPYYDDCRQNCRVQCVSCAGYANCTECVDGSYGTYCQHNCYSGCEGGVCDKMDGKCTCETGYTSRWCEGQLSCTSNPCACCKNNKCETNNGNNCTDGCIDGIWGDRCARECPSDCLTCTHDSVDSGRPCTACVHGKYSGRWLDIIFTYYDDCRLDCRDNCASCTGTNNCTECNNGHYGTTCQYDCYSGCEGGVCDKMDGQCTCRTGYASRFCKGQPSCTNNPCVCCKNKQCEINNDNFCTDGCIDGYWGARCVNVCLVNCVTCTQDSKDRGRPCTACVPGKYSGRLGDYSFYSYYDDCRLDCSDSCVSCTSYHNCTECVDGRYGTDCNDNCRSECVSCASLHNCTECVDGYYGTDCQYSCYSGCEGGVCDKMNGQCTCKTGYASRLCRGQPSCTTNPCVCCKNNKCELNNGNTCTDGCIDGIWGDSCSNECPSDCVTCTQYSVDSGRPCTACVPGKYNGRSQDWINCTDCVDGRHGPNCSSVCSTGCKGGICSKTDGSCPCVNGRYGTCEYYCENGCQDGSCNKTNGNCNCKSGFTGVNCDRCASNTYGSYPNCTVCPDKCLTCSSSNSCDSCLDGYYNGYNAGSGVTVSDCSNQCRINCKTCSEYEVCSACMDGFWGEICVNYCSNGCEGGTCNINDGQCSCKMGFSGDKCCVNNDGCLTCSLPTVCSKCTPDYDINTNCSECVLNKYGQNCGNNCNSNCLSNGELRKCYGHNGTCVVGCQEGFFGDKCDLRCHQNCKYFTCSRFNGICIHGCQDGFIVSGSDCEPALSKDFPVEIISGAIGGAVVLGIITAVVVVFIMKRRNNRQYCCSVTTNDETQGREERVDAIANEGFEMTAFADNSENREIDEIVRNDPDDMENGAEGTSDGYEVPIPHYDTIKDSSEPRNQQNEPGDCDDSTYEPIAIRN